MSELNERDDEIVSAYLDGEATLEEVARVESEPRLRSRLEELRAAARAVADEPVDAPDPGPLVERALAAGGEPAASLAAHRATRSREGSRRRRGVAVLTTAAAVAVVVLGLALVTLTGQDADEKFAQVGSSINASGGGQGSDAATGAPEAADDAQAEPSEQDAATAAPDQDAHSLEQGPAPVPVAHLGSFGSRTEVDAALDEAVEQLRGGEPESPAPETGLEERGDTVTDLSCVDQVAGREPELVGREPVTILAFQLPEGARQIIVYEEEPAATGGGAPLELVGYEVALADCEVVDRLELD